VITEKGKRMLADVENSRNRNVIKIEAQENPKYIKLTIDNQRM
jgi:hypothetical protein